MHLFIPQHCCISIAVICYSISNTFQAVFDLLAKKSDMAQLYLSQTADRQEHAEVELFLEGYHDDLHVLQLKVAALIEQVAKYKRSPS